MLITRPAAARAHKSTRGVNLFWLQLTGRRLRRYTFWLPPNAFWSCLEYPQAQLTDTELRERFLSKYSHTITDPEMISYLRMWAGKKGLVSVGAGTGWTEYLIAYRSSPEKIRDLLLFWRDFRVVAFDIAPPNLADNEYHHDRVAYFPVQLGGPEGAALYPEYTLLLSWPSPGPFALDALQAYQGSRLIYIGDPKWNADVPFWDKLNQDWIMVSSMPPIRWGRDDVTDWIAVFHRRQPN